MPGETGSCSFVTAMLVTGGSTCATTGFENPSVQLHDVPPAAYAVSLTRVETHTRPARPVIVNVRLVAG